MSDWNACGTESDFGRTAAPTGSGTASAEFWRLTVGVARPALQDR
jgi:hypothetical protein